MELLAFRKADIAADGRHLSLHFDTDEGPTVIEANAEALRSIAVNLLAALDATSRVADQDAPVMASEVLQTRIGPTPDRKHVLLGLRMKASLPGSDMPFVMYGVLAPSGARETAEKLRLAASQCR